MDSYVHELWHIDGARLRGAPPNGAALDGPDGRFRFEVRPGFQFGAATAADRFRRALRGFVAQKNPTHAIFQSRVNELFNLLFSSNSLLWFGKWHVPSSDSLEGLKRKRTYGWFGYKTKDDNGNWTSWLPDWYTDPTWVNRWINQAP